MVSPMGRKKGAEVGESEDEGEAFRAALGNTGEVNFTLPWTDREISEFVRFGYEGVKDPYGLASRGGL